MNIISKLIVKASSLNMFFQMFILIIVSFLIVNLFSLSFGFYKSLMMFMDPGNFDPLEYQNLNKNIFAIVLVFIGMLFSSSIVSMITNFLQNAVNEENIDKHVITLEVAFKSPPSLKTRNQIKSLNLNVNLDTLKLRKINMIDIEIDLLISKDEVIKAVEKSNQLRLRKINNQLFLEFFERTQLDKKFGCFINRKSKYTIIATQNYSDQGIGHFSHLLSELLTTNYISNEYFSSASLLIENRINFASNDDYIKPIDQNIKENKENILTYLKNLIESLTQTYTKDKYEREMNKKRVQINQVFENFYHSLLTLTKDNTTIIYLGTKSKTEHLPADIHITCGGSTLDIENFDFPNRTYQDSKKLQMFYQDLKTQLLEINMKTATHEHFGNSQYIGPSHLSQVLFKKHQKQIISIFISPEILGANDEQYYKFLSILKNTLSKHIL